MSRVATLMFLLLALGASLAQRASGQAPFSYILGASFEAGSPSTSYTVGVGNTANVTVAVDTTCRVVNTDQANSHSGTWNTNCDAYLLNSGTVVFHGTHTSTSNSYTIPAGRFIDINTDTVSTGGAVGIGTYTAEGWSGVSETAASPNYSTSQLKAQTMLMVHS